MPPKKTKKDEESSEKNDKPAASKKPASEKSGAKGSDAKKSAAKGKVSEGDIITMDFDAWVIDIDGTEELFDTTNEENAKSGDIFNEKATYGPIVTIIGDGRMIPGLDKSLQGAAIGKKTTLEIPPEDGAGERLPNMVEIFSVRELQKQDINPEPGMRVQIKNKTGTITNMTSGRVRIDFNDPLAGKTLKYDYNILKKAGTPEEKVLGIIEADYGRSDDFKAAVKGDELNLVLADMCKYDQAWFTLKYKVVSDLRQFLDIKTINFIEEYVKKEEPVEEPVAEEKPAKEEKVPEELAPEELGSEE
ncbi:MAG: peptidylprolyl isomerase [Thermoplasmata archaeon]|nr:peptidylprolyl isomerase [Thermoplasmata archaeon]